MACDWTRFVAMMASLANPRGPFVFHYVRLLVAYVYPSPSDPPSNHSFFLFQSSTLTILFPPQTLYCSFTLFLSLSSPLDPLSL